jgi:DNA-directed RNA polymerase specialized sigma24 family protein
MRHDQLVRSCEERDSAMGRGRLDESGEIPVRLRVLESWTVAEALASLHPDHREVLVETYYRKRSVADAATALGIPSETVKLRTFFALKALKRALQERGALTRATDVGA